MIYVYDVMVDIEILLMHELICYLWIVNVTYDIVASIMFSLIINFKISANLIKTNGKLKECTHR